MEALSALASNGLWSLATIVLIVVILLFAVKKGWLGANIKGVRIGQDEATRNLIRNAWEYSDCACDAQFTKIRPYCKSDEEAKYIIARVQDVMQKAIVYNHMTESESYVRAKQALVLNTIQKRLSNEHFFTPEFKSCCDRFVENLIKDLCRMKRIDS